MSGTCTRIPGIRVRVAGSKHIVYQRVYVRYFPYGKFLVYSTMGRTCTYNLYEGIAAYCYAAATAVYNFKAGGSVHCCISTSSLRMYPGCSTYSAPYSTGRICACESARCICTNFLVVDVEGDKKKTDVSSHFETVGLDMCGGVCIHDVDIHGPT